MKRLLFFALMAIITVFTLSSFSALATASQELELNTKVEFSIKKGDEVSYYFDIEEKGFFFLQFLADDVTPYKTVCDIEIKKGDSIIFSQKENSKGGLFSKYGEGLMPGRYSVSIKCNTRDVEQECSLKTEFTPTNYCETETSNSFEKAIPIEFGKKYYGFASELTEDDYYTFSTFHKGYIEIDAQNPVEFAIYDSDFTLLTSGEGCTTNANEPKLLRCYVLPGKVYYLVAKPHVDYQYTFVLNSIKDDTENTETENNHSPETALEIKPDTWYSGYVFGAGDHDYFYINAAFPGAINIRVEKEAGNGLVFSDWLEGSEEPDKDHKYSRYLSQSNYESDLKLKINGEDGIRYIKISPYLGSPDSSCRYRIKVSGEPLDYIIHPETKKLILKKEYEKELQSKEKDSPDSKCEEVQEADSISQFDDISAGSWYHDDILEARRLGLIEGIDKNNYAPKDTITVSQAITMAVRFHQKKNNIDYIFNRYDGDKWYDSYLIYAKNAKLISEDDFTNEELGTSATRAQMAYIFASVLTDPKEKLYDRIPDVNNKTPYATSIRKLYTLGVLKGNDEKGTFAPDTNISRAEAAVIILRASKI